MQILSFYRSLCFIFCMNERYERCLLKFEIIALHDDGAVNFVWFVMKHAA